MSVTRPRQTVYLYLLIALILIAAYALRISHFSEMGDMLHTDESFAASDAASLLNHPRFVPFLEANNGRESGYFYIVALTMLIVGIKPIALRFASLGLSMLAAAAIYRLARELFDRRTAVIALAVMAVLFMPVFFAHTGLRLNTFPPLGALSFSFLAQAIRMGKPRLWIAAGLALGFMVYTYYSELAWLALAALIMVAWLIKNSETRRWVALAIGIPAVIGAPLALYFYQHWVNASLHFDELQTAQHVSLVFNTWTWILAFLYQGTEFLEHNLPYRPLLDIPLALLFYPGLIALGLMRRRPWPALLVFALTALSIIPSIVTVNSPNFPRGVGVAVTIPLIAAAGAAWLIDVAKPVRPVAAIGVAALLIWAGANTNRDMQRWLRQDQIYVMTEEHITTGARVIGEITPPDQPVFFSPFNVSHPNVTFAAAELAPRPVGGFKSDSCIVISQRTTTYFSLIRYDVNFQEQLAQWMDFKVIAQDRRSPLPWVALQATPKPDALAGWVKADKEVFGDLMTFRVMNDLPDHAAPGDTIRLWIGTAAIQPDSTPWKGFVHLYGHPSPYEGGPIFAQTDQQLCPSYPSDHWRPDEIVLSRFDLALPPDLPPDTYTVVFGIYDEVSRSRLVLTHPATFADHLEIHTLTVQK